MKNTWHSLHKAITNARAFNLTLRKLKAIFPKEKTYILPITEDQLGILFYCAVLDVKDFKALAKLTKIEHPITEKERICL